MHGKGTYVWPDTQQCYTGQWVDGKRHGDGRHHFSSRSADPSAGDYYDGEWKEGVMHGKARYVDAGGEEHEGVWAEGVCPEVDFSHVPESGSFRYRFSVRTAPACVRMCVRKTRATIGVYLFGVFFFISDELLWAVIVGKIL